MKNNKIKMCRVFIKPYNSKGYQLPNVLIIIVVMGDSEVRSETGKV